jgi:hypothetical protein
MSVAAVQDREMAVEVRRSPMKVGSVQLPPQGDPTAYGRLRTPSGNALDLVPPGFRAPFSGASMLFAHPMASSGSRIARLGISILAGARRVSGILICPASWWAAPRSCAALLDELAAAFPRIPAVWLEVFATHFSSDQPPVLRCAPCTACMAAPYAACVHARGDVWLHSALHLLPQGCRSQAMQYLTDYLVHWAAM